MIAIYGGDPAQAEESKFAVFDRGFGYRPRETIDRGQELDGVSIMKIPACLLSAALGVASAGWADSRGPFLFLKTGEKFATQEVAGPTVAGLTAYVGEKVAGSTNAFEPRVMNDPVKAAEFSGKSKPALGIVTAGFYLTYAKALGMEPLLETRRTGVKEERYVLVARKDASDELSKLEGKTIATPLAGEQRYVIGVVLQASSAKRFGSSRRWTWKARYSIWPRARRTRRTRYFWRRRVGFVQGRPGFGPEN